MKRPALPLVTGITAAMLAACYIKTAAIPALFTVCAVLTAAIVISILRKHRAAAIILLLAGVIAGVLSWYVFTALRYTPAVRYDGESGIFVCDVAQRPSVYDDYTSLTVRAVTLDGEKMGGFFVLLYLDGDYSSLSPGDRLTLEGTELSVPESRWNFDKFRYYRSRGIYLTAQSKNAPLTEQGAGLDWRLYPVYLAGRCAELMSELVESPCGEYINALIFGITDGLGDEFNSNLRITGLSHIAAVSGMQVSFITGLTFMLLKRRTGSVIALPLIVFFVMMTGGSPSVLRAGIMQLIWITAYFVRREADPVTSLLLSLGIILLISPYEISSVGLWLSFFSTLGLILCGGHIRGFLMRPVRTKNRALRAFANVAAGALSTTLSAQLFVLPVQILVFREISLVAPVSNLLIVFPSEITFTSSLIILPLALISKSAGAAAAFIPGVLAKYQISVINTLAKLPAASISSQSVYVTAFMIYAYVMALLWYFLKPKRRAFAVGCLVSAFILTAAFQIADRTVYSYVSVVDTVGGQSVIINDRDAVVVINCGGGYGSACSAVFEELRVRNTRAADLFIITDYRSASAGNAEVFLRKVQTAAVVLPRPDSAAEEKRRGEIETAAAECGTRVEYVDGVSDYAFGTVDARVIETSREGGDYGRFIVAVNDSGYKILTLGAVYPENAGYIISEYGLGNADLIAAGDYYTGRMVPPAALPSGVCVFSSYHGVSADVRGRVAGYGVTVLETERMGAVRVKIPRL